MADCDFEVVDSSDPELPYSDDDSSEEEGEEQDADKQVVEKEDPDYKMVFLVRKDLNMSGGKVAAQVSHAVHRLLGKAYRETREYQLQEKEVLRELNGLDSDAGGNSSPTDQAPLGEVSSFRNVLLWEQLGCKKITLQVDSLEQLVEIRKKARASGFATSMESNKESGEKMASSEHVNNAASAQESASVRNHSMQQELIIPTATIRDAGHTEVEPGTCTVLGLGPCKSSTLDPITGHLKSFKMKSPEQYEKDKEKVERRLQQEIDKQTKKVESLEKQLKKAKADEAQLINLAFRGLH
jgi:peptidyl-tRNA hydrolase